MAEKPTQSFLDHLKLREGSESYVYADTLKKLTGGTGHLLTADELLKYKEGDVIDEAIITKWLEEDSTKAYNAAISQAKEAGITDQAFIEALGSVNFQLGTNWRGKMKNAWKAIKAGEFDKAIDEIQFKSGEKGTETEN
jgi:GH24 family phage-related lysozyme (muramidase)